MTTCILCPVYHPSDPPRPPKWPPVCEPCRRRATDDLGQIPAEYARLRDALEPGSTHGPKVATTRTPPIPANLDALSLLGPGSAELTELGRREEQLGELPTAVLLTQWVSDWADLRGQGEHLPPPAVAPLTAWLLHRLPWALENHPAIDDFAHEVHKTLRTLRAVGRTTSGESAGRCPALLRDDTRCGTRLGVDPYLDRIQCARCGTAWDRRDQGWVKLRARQARWSDEEAA